MSIPDGDSVLRDLIQDFLIDPYKVWEPVRTFPEPQHWELALTVQEGNEILRHRYIHIARVACTGGSGREVKVLNNISSLEFPFFFNFP